MDDFDHRSLGNTLDLWHIQDDAPGMVFWHARGYAVYRVLEDYIRKKMRRRGYAEVRTPQLMPRELWAEKTLGDVARRCGFFPRLRLGEGAFYGPKLEFALGDRVGRSWQCGTVQLDCVLPARLEAAYVAPDGSRAIPLMIHHAVLGSLERFTAVLVEHYGGALPFWLSPEQVVIAPISQQQSDYAAEVVEALEDAGIRTALYDQGETLSRRIVIAREAQVPVMAVLGRREKAARTLTLRERDGTQAVLSLLDAVAMLSKRR
jgi:threonyl-tRNA synthetase